MLCLTTFKFLLLEVRKQKTQSWAVSGAPGRKQKPELSASEGMAGKGFFLDSCSNATWLRPAAAGWGKLERLSCTVPHSQRG